MSEKHNEIVITRTTLEVKVISALNRELGSKGKVTGAEIQPCPGQHPNWHVTHWHGDLGSAAIDEAAQLVLPPLQRDYTLVLFND
jgi:hypothetical protein